MDCQTRTQEPWFKSPLSHGNILKEAVRKHSLNISLKTYLLNQINYNNYGCHNSEATLMHMTITKAVYLNPLTELIAEVRYELVFERAVMLQHLFSKCNNKKDGKVFCR